MKQSRALGLLFLAALVFALSGCAPVVKRLPTPTAAPEDVRDPASPLPRRTPQPALLERRELILEWPETLREKDSGLITLMIVMDEQGQATATIQTPANPGGTPIDIPNIYDTHNIVAVARLDLAGMEAYRENIREPLRPGLPVSFSWSIRANEAGAYQGVVWLRLELVPKKGGPIEEMLLLARPVDIKVVTILGMSGSLARILGGAGLLLGTILGYPLIQTWVAEWLKRRKRKNPPAARRKETVEPAQKEAEKTEKT